MRVTMIAVVTLDGCLTKHDESGASGWASREDQLRYRELLSACDVHILGAGTYREHRAVFQRLAGEGGAPMHVLTREPGNFVDDERPGRLVFTADAPGRLIDRLRDAGHRRCALLGGGHVYNSYLGAGVVDELCLTLEPRVFGSGRRLAADTPIDVGFSLRTVEHLNDSTLFLSYDRRR